VAIATGRIGPTRPAIIGGVPESADRVRVDKWLWAARLLKTRSLAAEAVKGGRVQVNGQRVKASKEVGPGDQLEVTIGQSRRTVVVQGVAERRGPPKEAALLFEETPESVAARELAAEQRRLASPPPGANLAGRPTKRDRRRFEATRGGRGRP
jgi:ribosome-associated heat shock protein Hsp15